MLAKERQMSYDLIRENTELKLKLKDFEIAAAGPNHHKKKILPTTSPVLREQVAVPLGKENENELKDSSQARKRLLSSNNYIEGKAHNAKNNNSIANKNGKRKTMHANPTGREGASKNKARETEMRKVVIIGDSQLRKIDGEKLSNDCHRVTVKAMPGSKVGKMKNEDIEADTNVVIIHAGTCNIRKQTNPESLADEIVSTLCEVKRKVPRSQVAFSSILKRNDDLELNAKVIKTNKLLEEKLLLSGLDFINNDNLRYGNISFDGLHINEGGVRILASNFSKYISYC